MLLMRCLPRAAAWASLLTSTAPHARTCSDVIMAVDGGAALAIMLRVPL
jgi:hypothetical protein